MTERDWLTSRWPERMLDVLVKAGISPRKLRLFACACLWREAHTDKEKDVLLFAERMADGLTGGGEAATDTIFKWAVMGDALAGCRAILSNPWGTAKYVAPLRDVAGNPFRAPAITSLTPTAVCMARAIYADKDFAALPLLADALEEADCDNADLLAHLRGWEPCVHCAGARHRTPCPHCRGTGWRPLRGPHARGCWALDLILGKG